MSRVGKIARLPEQIREQINCRLQDGEEGRKIIAWLNSMDEVKTILAQEFEGHEIIDSNLSHWRSGGFRDWQGQQSALAEARRVMAEGTELAEIGKNALADKLAVWLVGRYIVATRKLLDSEDDAESWKLLRELCHDVVALRRGDHSAEWLRLEQERIKLQRQKNARERKKEKSASQPVLLPALSEEEKDRKFDEIFGTDPEMHLMYGMHKWNQTPADASAAAPAPVAASAEVKDPPPSVPSPEEAEAMVLKAITVMAENGDAESAYCLGAWHRDGCRVPKDLVKAREWLGKAAVQGIGGAKIELHALMMRFGDLEDRHKAPVETGRGSG